MTDGRWLPRRLPAVSVRRRRIVGFWLSHAAALAALGGRHRISKETNQICFESGSHIAARCSLGFAIFLLHLKSRRPARQFTWPAMARASARRTTSAAPAGFPDDTVSLRASAAVSAPSSWIGSPRLWASIALIALTAAAILLFTAQDGMSYFEATGRKNYATIAPPTIRPTLMNVFPHDPQGTVGTVAISFFAPVFRKNVSCH